MLHIERLCVGFYGENAYLAYLDGREDCFVVDPGDRADLIAGAIARAGRSLTHILITHGHFDHILAARDLREQTGARVLIHALDAQMLLDPAPLKLPPEAQPLFHPLTADERLQEGELALCGLLAQVIHTPGHTPGGACFYLPAHRAVFTGDTLFRHGFGRTDFAGGSTAQLRQSLLRLLQLPGDVMVYPGHDEAAPMAEIAGRYR